MTQKYVVVIKNNISAITCVGWDSAVGKTIRYELDGPGIESLWGEIFRTHRERPWGPPSHLYNEYRVSSPGLKRSGRGVNHPFHLGSRLKKE
jgi:hypothetical protein